MAQDINNVILVGRLGRDIEIRYTPSGVPVGTIALANTRSVKKGDVWVDETNWFQVALFGKQAERLSNYLLKGQQICVNGSLRFEQWEKDGQKHSKVSVVADTIQLLGSKKDGSTSHIDDSTAGHYASKQEHKPAQVPDYSGGGFDEDIPF